MQFTNFLLDYKFLSKLGFFNSKCNSDRRYSQIPVMSLCPLTDKFNIVSSNHGRTQRCNFPFHLDKFGPKNHNH